MDRAAAVAILAAIETDNASMLIDVMPWDAREAIVHPVSGDALTFARLGTYVLAYSATVGFGLHDHESEEWAVACFDSKVAEARELVESFTATPDNIGQMVAELQADMAAYERRSTGRHAAPDEGMWI